MKSGRGFEKTNSILKDLEYVNKRMPNKMSIENINEIERIFNIVMTYELVIVRMRVSQISHMIISFYLDYVPNELSKVLS